MRYITAFGIGVAVDIYLIANTVSHLYPPLPPPEVDVWIRWSVVLLICGITALVVVLSGELFLPGRRAGFKHSFAYVGLVTALGMFLAGFWINLYYPNGWPPPG